MRWKGSHFVGRVSRAEAAQTSAALLGSFVLSYSSLKTPQILELSGIGKRDVLERLGIPLHVDLPVGENLQEHITCGLSFGNEIPLFSEKSSKWDCYRAP